MQNINKPIRRNNKELEQLKNEIINTKFTLIDQPDFKGSSEMLKEMQKFERAYRNGKPLISDEEWDKLVKQYNYMESLDEVVSPGGRKWIKLSSPLVSLKKICNYDDLKVFTDKYEELDIGPKLDGLTFNIIYILNSENNLFEFKKITTRGDGLNGLELYEKALYGVELFGLPKTINPNCIPEKCIIDGKLELRGESVIDRFKYCNENNLDIEKLVARSIPAGMFNRKEPQNYKYLQHITNENFESIEEAYKNQSKECKKNFIRFKITGKKGVHLNAFNFKNDFYEYKKDLNKFENINDSIQRIMKKEHLYFITFSISSLDGNIHDKNILKNIDGIDCIYDIDKFPEFGPLTQNIVSKSKDERFNIASNIVDTFYGTINGERDFNKIRYKNEMKFMCDGIVIKNHNSDINSQKLTPKIKNGKIVLPKAPIDQVAVKLETDPIKTKIIKINKKVTNLGNVTFSAEIEPVLTESGAMVSRVNLHNENWINLPENNWIREGIECNLQMSMDIIPILSEIK